MGIWRNSGVLVRCGLMFGVAAYMVFHLPLYACRLVGAVFAKRVKA